MIEGQSMTTVADVVAQVRDGRLEDFVREAVVLVARELMEAEISSEVGAELGEVAPEARSTHRNGYFPSFLEARRPAEQAIVAVVMEAYVNGVSTRKVDRLVEQLGIGGMSKDRVSAICRGLDEKVQAFCERPLEGAYPYLWLDAKHVKVRDHGRVVSKALVVAYAVHETGIREVIGLDVGEVESGSFWVEFLRGLKKRGLAGVRLAITDQHEGLKGGGRAGAGLSLAALLGALCRRPGYADPGFGSLWWWADRAGGGRHNQSASRKARSVSGGW
jgi:putative transposase